MLPEYWLRGPVDDIPALLQPVAHALLQAREELNSALENFPDDKLWQKPAGMASIGFHLQHITGVLDRLLTYARGEFLSDEQLLYLKNEGMAQPGLSTGAEMRGAIDAQLEKVFHQLKTTNPGTLTESRGVGRAQLPSTVGGLLFHAAEHTMRHLGQLLVTSAVVNSE